MATGLTLKNSKLYIDGQEYSAGGGGGAMTAARLMLPRYMDVVAGKQCDFWLNDCIKNTDGLPVRFDTDGSTTGFGLYEDGHVRIFANATAGELDVVLKTYKADEPSLILNNNASVLIGSQTMTIRKVAASGGSGTKNILIVGDSLTEGPYSGGVGQGSNPVETYKLLAEDGDVTVNQIGTQTVEVDGVTYRHEGHGSTSWSWFTDNASSPFVKNGVFSFASYMADNFPSLSGIDYCVVMLGTNTFNSTSSIANQSKKFIDKLLSDYPNCKIAVGIPALGADYTDIPTQKQDILKSAGEIYLDLYDNGKYNENVTCIGHGCWVDRVNDYSWLTTYKTTPYSQTNMKMPGDTIHPMAQGYKQWGRAVYCKIRSWIAGNL